jgi:hypothetical protein
MPKKLKNVTELSARDKLSAKFDADLLADYEANGPQAIAAARVKAPDKYLDTVNRRIAAVEPNSEAVQDAKNMHDLAFRILKKFGCNEFNISEDMLEDVIAENNRHLDAVQAIPARAEAKEAMS